MPPDTASAVIDRAPAGRRPGSLVWVFAALPLVLLGLLVTFIVRSGPAEVIQGSNVPPVENLAITQARLAPGSIELTVFNDGPDAVTIAQVIVDDAFWTFQTTTPTLAHLQRAHITIPYPWVHGEAHVVRLLTSTGLTFDHVIPVAIETPRPDARFFGIFALIGLYVGVIPVALGLMWYPLMRHIGQAGMQFLLALTVGLLAYLLVDAGHDGLEAAVGLPGSLQGVAIFAFGAVGAFLLLDLVGARLALRRRARSTSEGGVDAWVLAVLIAVGIGLHNFGEGLAIGSAFALGELGLGTLLIVGFTLHNTTEGLAIVAPLARRGSERLPLADLIKLGLIGGVPTIAGAWLGAFVYSPVLAVFFLALGVGAIAQVTRQIVQQSARDGGIAAYFRRGAVVSGLAAGVAIMFVTGLLLG